MGLTAGQKIEAAAICAANERVIEAQGFTRQFGIAMLENGKWLAEILEESEGRATIKVGMFGFPEFTWFATVPSEMVVSRQIQELALRNAGIL